MNNPAARIQALPKEIQDRVDKNDPYWCWLPPGWHDIVVQLDAELRKIDPDYRLNQCKEKFGCLRYYVTWSDKCIDSDAAESIIHKYEEISGKTCDACGLPGKIRSVNGWLACRCKEHIVKEKKLESG